MAAVRSFPIISERDGRRRAGTGLEGDRYHRGAGTYSRTGGSGREVTLIEEEAVDALRRDYEIEFGAGDSRRNIVTRGIRLCEPIEPVEPG